MQLLTLAFLLRCFKQSKVVFKTLKTVCLEILLTYSFYDTTN